MFTDRLPLTLTPKTISLLLVICNRGLLGKWHVNIVSIYWAVYDWLILLGAAHNSTDFEVSLAFNGIFGTVIVIAILLAIITVLSLYVRKKKLERAQQLNRKCSTKYACIYSMYMNFMQWFKKRYRNNNIPLLKKITLYE